MSSADEDQPLLTLLNAVTQRQRDALVAALTRRGFAGVALPGVRLLAELTQGARSVQALADATATTKQFCAREVKRLAQGGYVTLANSVEDRRVTLVLLTTTGRRLMAAVRQAKRELDGVIAQRLGAADARTLRRLLARLNEP
jgi:DNA-binding MarR family transcriptional regulator